MVFLTINKTQVDFPYPPYPVQLRYMHRVIDALRNGDNALLESPTGTGKTLCLLCATLAWRRTYNAGLAPPAGPASSLAALIRPDLAPQLSTPRIIFCSRTHSQLAQAVAELKKTVYKPGMSLLASRDQLCVHDIASTFSGSRLNAKCRRITAPAKRQCRFHLPVASNRPHENRAPELIDKLHSQPPMDIEDVRAFGISEGACPWFLSRAAAKTDSCEILFLPYNYLLDRSARQSLGIDWVNDILIIDEAHNLEAVCADAMSFDLPESVRVACLSELSQLIEYSIQIRLMRSILNDVEAFINGVQFDRGEGSDISFRVFPASELRKQFESSGALTAETYEMFLELLDRAMGIQAEVSKPESSSGRGLLASQAPILSAGSNTIKIVQTAIRVLFESAASGYERSCRTVVQQNRSKPGRTVSYWCFKPAVTMRNLQSLKMRSMLLTSGTLSPMESFASELGVHFPIRLENPHVVTKPQIWAGVIKTGPDHEGQKGGRLTSAFYARGDAAHVELGRTMIKIASLVPDGLLAFFPSYGSLHSCIEAWKRLGPGLDGARPSVWEHLLRHKQIVAEERDAAKCSAAILAHRTNVDARVGSILLAVCRGKVSEGIDFSDEYGRAVVITGLPFPAAMDPKVILKREISDEEAKAWYTGQALRAVNQAVGRAIRHKYDYGAIILCDERYQSKNVQKQVSKWIRPSLTICPSFGDAEQSLGSFFSNAVKSSFAKDGEARRLEARRKKKESGADKRPEENTDAVVVAQEAISRILPPPKSEEQFLKQIFSLSDELATRNGKRKEKIEVHPRAKDTPKFRILDFSGDRARGGLKDSGFGGNDKRPRPNKRATQESSRSSEFLAARAKRIEDEEGRGKPSPLIRREKRLRTAASGQSTEGMGRRKRREVAFSVQIKQVFEGQEGIRQFLALFREILRIQTEIKEGTGPLQSDEQLQACLKEAKASTEKIIALIREKANGEDIETFLRNLRVKFPVEFRHWYDAAL
ncbi:unnamed protein product [Chondrus crispus]|uniref:Helicase ATP-binding domain-containing protein n=1 Tax=Chondrus crispus TaxID=2769 RepID=R7QGI7_CHOCR|nr:unnamed protein product [Chondrus crispus]CDF36878.1 unnamed protein product [Chondrus crispus]|eukprot:XP_005716697.1 unnamed protein product [Chondrus crispus]